MEIDKELARTNYELKKGKVGIIWMNLEEEKKNYLRKLAVAAAFPPKPPAPVKRSREQTDEDSRVCVWCYAAAKAGAERILENYLRLFLWFDAKFKWPGLAPRLSGLCILGVHVLGESQKSRLLCGVRLCDLAV